MDPLLYERKSLLKDDLLNLVNLVEYSMSSSKRVELDAALVKSPSLAKTVFTLQDMVSSIIVFLNIFEVINFCTMHKYGDNYLKENDNSIVPVKRVLTYHFGNIFISKPLYFKLIYKKSFGLIRCIYFNIFKYFHVFFCFVFYCWILQNTLKNINILNVFCIRNYKRVM